MQSLCDQCQQYKNQGHNYCRVCGRFLREGELRYVRLAHTYFHHEKFCGYCGGPKRACECIRPKPAG